jgi:hypothetical protein
LTSTNIDDYSSIQKYPEERTINNNDYLKSENYNTDKEIILPIVHTVIVLALLA